jgi:hypothetical protein
VTVAAFSAGTSRASYLGLLYPDIPRVALIAGPDDGTGGTTEDEWMPTTNVRLESHTDARYYGLIHKDNHLEAYRTLKDWHTYGMDFPGDPPRMEFSPTHAPSYAPFTPNATEVLDADGRHVLVSQDQLPTDCADPGDAAHVSVNGDKYVNCPGAEGVDLGYEPAWRCILGTGDASMSRPPRADAGAARSIECQGNGGASVALDGSGSRDPDCDQLDGYTWSGPFGSVPGQQANVFLPVGTNDVALDVSDGWSSDRDTTEITVTDTQPPSISLRLTPTVLWPPNHKLVRVDATVNVSDSCSGATAVLTSVTSDQPDNGTGDGDAANDIQGAALGTSDLSFFLRAERSGQAGRTYTVVYTVTDASGNRAEARATVRVPSSAS